MRESIGTVSLLNFIIFFIFLVFAFLAGTFSYYKAYRVNNAMVAAIEKYEGFNKYAYNEIEEKLSSFGYERVNFTCPNGNGTLVGISSKEGTNDNKKVTNDNKGYTGYCIYRYAQDDATDSYTDQYDSYEVTTVITFQFPVIQDLLKLRVSARTRRIYNFEENCKAMNICESK